MRPYALLAALSLAAAAPVLGAGDTAQPTADAGGDVRLPRAVYDRLIDHSRAAPRPAAAGYVLGPAQVEVEVENGDGDAPPHATVEVALSVEVLAEDGATVPLVPVHTPLATLRVDDRPVPLVPTADGLAWLAAAAGSRRLALRYRIEAGAAGGGGLSLALPVPAAASLTFSARLPGTDATAAVVPALTTRVRREGAGTRVEATVPSTRALQLVWQPRPGPGWTVSRARYAGRVEGDAIAWRAELDVEVWRDGALTVPLMPRGVALSALQLDGDPAPILLDGDRFATVVRGAGRHRVELGFQVPITHREGPPRAIVPLPAVPLSRFELTVPGNKAVTVTPAASVAHQRRDGATVATVFAPMSEQLVFGWAEAVPAPAEVAVRAAATVAHAVHAADGVLAARALVTYEVTRGAPSVIRLTLPAGAQVDRVTAADGSVADWRPGDVDRGRRALDVYLDRPLTGSALLRVDYDLALDGDRPFAVPLVDAPEARRRRSLIALLASPAMTLTPVEKVPGTLSDEVPDEVPGTTETTDNEEVTGTAKVPGTALRPAAERQLPASLRAGLPFPVAHTLSYLALPTLIVRPTVPPPVPGRFDARVDTLISVDEVSVQGQASVLLEIKAGTVERLRLTLPADTALLTLSGPSVREHTVAVDDTADDTAAGGGTQSVDVAFTQPIAGQLRLEASYERLLGGGDDTAGAGDAERTVAVPRLSVAGAEVEQGRIAIETRAAIAVTPAEAVHLRRLDPSSLPRQLVLRTRNPILHAFAYPRASPAPALTLALRRHRPLTVQDAAIERAAVHTLVTRDGLRVTTARYALRNGRQPFLRLTLPPASRLWSATVDGQAVEPATDDHRPDRAGDDRLHVLLRIPAAAQAVPVEVVYETAGSALGGLGTLRLDLPRPDVLVTATRWDLDLPDDLRWGRPASSLEPAGGDPRPPAASAPPMAARRLSLAGLYANRDDAPKTVALRYASPPAVGAGRALSALGALGLCAGLVLWRSGRRRAGMAAAVAGAVAVLAPLAIPGPGLGPALLVAAVALGAALAPRLWRRWQGAG